MTHPVAAGIGPVTFAVLTGPDGAVIVAIGGDLDIASAPAVRERLLSLLRPGACRLVIDMSAVRYADASGLAVLVSTQRRAVLLGGGLHAAVAALLASADAWRDADPRRRFSPALRALAQADAGNSQSALVQAARSLLLVLGREPLTYSPVVAATASRLRRLFPAGRRPAMGRQTPEAPGHA